MRLSNAGASHSVHGIARSAAQQRTQPGEASRSTKALLTVSSLRFTLLTLQGIVPRTFAERLLVAMVGVAALSDCIAVHCTAQRSEARPTASLHRQSSLAVAEITLGAALSRNRNGRLAGVVKGC